MRFLPICISVLLLAAGAGCSAYLLERLRSSHISLAILGAVLTLVLLAYFATGRQEKGAWVRFGFYGAGNDDLRCVGLDGDRPSCDRGLLFLGLRRSACAPERL